MHQSKCICMSEQRSEVRYIDHEHIPESINWACGRIPRRGGELFWRWKFTDVLQTQQNSEKAALLFGLIKMCVYITGVLNLEHPPPKTTTKTTMLSSPNSEGIGYDTWASIRRRYIINMEGKNLTRSQYNCSEQCVWINNLPSLL